MTDTTALARRTITLDTWRAIKEMSPTMHAARLFGVASPEQAAAVMVLGHDLGFSLSQSFQFVHIVQGKPSLSPRGALALVRQSGLLEEERIVEQPESCTVYMKRRGGGSYELTVTKAQMVAAVTGASHPDSPWQKYTANMLRWRAVGWVIDYLFPDVAGGLKRADEFGAAVDRAGDVVEGTFSVVEPAPAPEAEPAPTVEALVARYGADKLIEANGGRIPATDDELRKAAATLHFAYPDDGQAAG